MDGERIGDSTIILERLKKTGGIDLDAHLSPREKAQKPCAATDDRRTVEFFVLGYSRWLERKTGRNTNPILFGKMPWVLRRFLPQMVRQVRKAYEAQGIRRHSRDEIYALGKADLDAMSRIGATSPSSLVTNRVWRTRQLLAFPHQHHRA